jgi:hypothetical protein
MLPRQRFGSRFDMRTTLIMATLVASVALACGGDSEEVGQLGTEDMVAKAGCPTMGAIIYPTAPPAAEAIVAPASGTPIWPEECGELSEDTSPKRYPSVSVKGREVRIPPEAIIVTSSEDTTGSVEVHVGNSWVSYNNTGLKEKHVEEKDKAAFAELLAALEQ